MSTIKANTLLHSDGSTTNPPAIPALDQRMASAWINFNGTSTVAIRDSENVSSITDNSVGRYSVNFLVTMDDANYSAVTSVGDDNFVACLEASSISTSLFKIEVTKANTNTLTDRSYVCAAVMGGQS